MTVKNQKKPRENNDNINPVAAAVTGAVIGAGVAFAGAMALSNEKTREKMKEALTNAKDQAVGFVGDVQKQAQIK